jgi:hypothetical protein
MKETYDMTQKYTILRTNDTDIEIEGDFVGSASSYHEKCGGRWTEIDIYRTTGGTYVVQLSAMSQWISEKNFHAVGIVKTMDEMVAWFRDHADGRITDTAKSAMADAGLTYTTRVE